MRALKALVIFMGILIVAGVIIIIVTIYNRSQINPDKSLTSKFLIPQQSDIIQILELNEGIGMHLYFSDGRQYIYIYDAKSGEITNKISIIKE
ncbi:DUF6476 family protein [Alphaproteobacteria bacterium]|nr:DUF6476 family protein [Alphaproteobacteria bacterium]|tara:strand:+ start:202 stop:480 length:279 start_codon:yes stop_codon:yes gene_type:complete